MAVPECGAGSLASQPDAPGKVDHEAAAQSERALEETPALPAALMEPPSMDLRDSMRWIHELVGPPLVPPPRRPTTGDSGAYSQGPAGNVLSPCNDIPRSVREALVDARCELVRDPRPACLEIVNVEIFVQIQAR